MKVYEIRFKVYLLKDILLSDMQEKCAAIIDRTLFQDEVMQVFHEEPVYKNYCFGSLYPIEKGKIYQRGKVYTLSIRTIDENLMQFFSTALEKTVTREMKGLEVSVRALKEYPIREICTVTPMLMKDDRGYWRNFMSIEDYSQRLMENLLKKYRQYTGEEMDEDFPFYTAVEFRNLGPIVCQYKDIKLLGDKLILRPSSHENAQKLVYMALGTGLGENNARGYGFLSYRYV